MCQRPGHILRLWVNGIPFNGKYVYVYFMGLISDRKSWNTMSESVKQQWEKIRKLSQKFVCTRYILDNIHMNPASSYLNHTIYVTQNRLILSTIHIKQPSVPCQVVCNHLFYRSLQMCSRYLTKVLRGILIRYKIPLFINIKTNHSSEYL